jgi:LmbE family N-acetylglucosaminyl deacetylase
VTVADTAPFSAADGEHPVLVVAHPDDEALWFSSILGRVRKIIVCYRDDTKNPAMAAARKLSLADHPLAERIVDLGLEEGRSIDRADWSAPEETADGLALRDPPSAAAYAEQAAALRRALPAELAGATAVFTHNPWGEYGHEDHVQVCRIVTHVAIDLGLTVWYSTYASFKSLPLLRRYLGRGDQQYVLQPSDPALGEKIAAAYRRHGAWTWFDDYQWFAHDCFIRGPLDKDHGQNAGWLAPINLLDPRHEPLWTPRPPAPLAQRIRRRLGRLVRGPGDSS